MIHAPGQPELNQFGKSGPLPWLISLQLEKTASSTANFTILNVGFSYGSLSVLISGVMGSEILLSCVIDA